MGRKEREEEENQRQQQRDKMLEKGKQQQQQQQLERRAKLEEAGGDSLVRPFRSVSGVALPRTRQRIAHDSYLSIA